MTTRICTKCQRTLDVSEFYKRPQRKSGFYNYCKKCFDAYNDKRRIELKEKAIRYKGSKCIRCFISYPETPSCVFDFHHRNPREKGDWSSIRKRSWDKIREEIDKCDLLCSNCHRIVHSEMVFPSGVEPEIQA